MSQSERKRPSGFGDSDIAALATSCVAASISLMVVDGPTATAAQDKANFQLSQRLAANLA
jgi:hypothetical protein